MSHAAGKVRFDDGTVMCFDYYATTGHARTRLYVSMDEVYESWERPNDRFECSCGRHENVHLAIDYGNGIQWQGRACRHCMAITHGLTPYCEDVFTWDGLPDWWHNRPPVNPLLDFLPRKPLHTPTTIVVPGDNPDHPPMPLAYFMNGYLRHHERLSGMAGDRNDNKLLFP